MSDNERSCTSKWLLLTQFKIYNEHPYLSFYTRWMGTSYTISERIMGLMMSISTLFAIACLFYGQEGRSSYGDYNIMFWSAVLSLLPNELYRWLAILSTSNYVVVDLEDIFSSAMYGLSFHSVTIRYSLCKMLFKMLWDFTLPSSHRDSHATSWPATTCTRNLRDVGSKCFSWRRAFGSQQHRRQGF